MRSWSIPAGRFFGANVRIHLTFVLLLIYLWSIETYHHPVKDWWRALALVGIIFGAVVLHEIGHALGALRSGGKATRSVVLMPIGSVAMLDEADRQIDEKREFRMALAGTSLNLLLALLVGSVLLGIPQVHLLSKPFLDSYNLPRSLVWANLLLAGLNLLPAYPLDGGRLLRASFARRLDTVRATRRVVAISQGFAMLFIFAGMWHNSLMMVGFFLFVAAQLEERSVVFQSVLDKVRMEDVMLTDFATLSPADTLEDALTKAVHSLQDDFPVIRGSDMVGVVSRQKIMEELRAQGNGYVQAVMNRGFHIADRSESLGTAFRRISTQGMTIIPVVDSGRLVGIVTLQNLMHSMTLLAETKKLRREMRANEE
jgi:Zn-dependent protease/predicted transcriptional regulator